MLVMELIEMIDPDYIVIGGSVGLVIIIIIFIMLSDRFERSVRHGAD